MDNTLAFILAGGKGERLMPLTKDRAKPAVPFGTGYRIVDFVLSNIAPHVRNTLVLTQYKKDSLERHVNRFAYNLGQDHHLETVSPSFVGGDDMDMYKDTADAVLKNRKRIDRVKPDHVAVFGADHVYRIDFSNMMDLHKTGNAITIAAMRTPIEGNFEERDGQKQFRFGVFELGANNKVLNFLEKPLEPPEIPEDPGYTWASMGNYVFNRGVLLHAFNHDFGTDFGKHIIPRLINDGHSVGIYPFRGYWTDVGDLKSFYDANMDLITDRPKMDLWGLYDNETPILTANQNIYPPTKLKDKRVLFGLNAIIEGDVTNSIIFPGARIEDGASVTDSIIFDRVIVKKGARIKNSIVDKHNDIDGEVGYDSSADTERGYTLDPQGSRITVVPLGEPKIGHYE